MDLVLQLVEWVAERPRTYAETMDAWRTSCPRLTIWEEANDRRLVAVGPAGQGGLNARPVEVTAAGRAALAEHGERASAA